VKTHQDMELCLGFNIKNFHWRGEVVH